MTALLDTGSQVTHVSHDFCAANGIEINPFAKLVNIEGTGGDSTGELGYAEASLSPPMRSHTFKTEALLLVLPTTDYLKKVSVSIPSLMWWWISLINTNLITCQNHGRWCVVPCILGSWYNHNLIAREP